MTTAPAPHKTGSLSRSSRSSCWKTTVRNPQHDRLPLVHLRSLLTLPLGKSSTSEHCLPFRTPWVFKTQHSVTDLRRGHVALSSACDSGHPQEAAFFELLWSAFAQGETVRGPAYCFLVNRTQTLSTDEGEIAPPTPYCLRTLGGKDSNYAAVSSC